MASPTENKNTSTTKEEEQQEEQDEGRGITDPRDSDVLCGRGGAALRHPGNQTYRRLVNLNKGLYITCLKTEKLKISRSIVAAIREQNGRFLEKEAKSKEGAWFDIGDKKAIEKTSQALREGQPKLRQKIVEMGGAAAMENQFGHAGIYPNQIGLAGGVGGGGGVGQMDPSMLDPSMMGPPQGHGGRHQYNSNSLLEQHHAASVNAAQAAAIRQHEVQHHVLQQPQDCSGDPMKNDLHAEMFQRLSLRNLNASEAEELHYQQQQHSQRQRQRLPPSLTQRSNVPHELGIGVGDSTLSLMSDFSGLGSTGVPNQSMLSMDVGSFRRPYGDQMAMGGGGTPTSYGSGGGGGGCGGFHNNSNGMPSDQQQIHPSFYPQQVSSQRDRQSKMDRRRVFAKMKYGVPPTQQPRNMPPPTKVGSSNPMNPGGMPAMSQHSYGDGMPDIHMVESTMSILSNMSTMTDGNSIVTNPNLALKREQEREQEREGKDIAVRPAFAPAQPESVQLKDHSHDIHWGGLGGGSRHSVMSGLSRVDDTTSLGGSVFSDGVAKKNTSTRSIAMSEISVLDMQCMQERENEDDDSDAGFEHGGGGVAKGKPQARSTSVEYDL